MLSLVVSTVIIVVIRADLCEAVYKKVGLSRAESATLVGLVLEEITDCLEHGETVELSSFGSFVVRKKGPRIRHLQRCCSLCRAEDAVCEISRASRAIQFGRIPTSGWSIVQCFNTRDA